MTKSRSRMTGQGRARLPPYTLQTHPSNQGSPRDQLQRHDQSARAGGRAESHRHTQAPEPSSPDRVGRASSSVQIQSVEFRGATASASPLGWCTHPALGFVLEAALANSIYRSRRKGNRQARAPRSMTLPNLNSEGGIVFGGCVPNMRADDVT